MAIKKRLNIVVRSSDEGKVIDSFNARGLLDNTNTKKCSESFEEKSNQTQLDITENYGTLEDVVGVGIQKSDVSLRTEIEIVLEGCSIKAKTVGFQANSTGTLTLGSETATESFINYLLTGE